MRSRESNLNRHLLSFVAENELRNVINSGVARRIKLTAACGSHGAAMSAIVPRAAR
jgi:hypothetical protein